MYYIAEIQDEVRVPPVLFGMKIEKAVKESISLEYENKWFDGLGTILAVTEVGEISEGKIMPGDGAAYFDTTFKALVFQPEVHEVVEGEVVDVAEFGAFVRIGPMDAICHISQLMDDKAKFDEKNKLFQGTRSKKSIKIGDIVRARISSIGMKREQLKIALTMRSPGLGSIKWLEQTRKRGKK